MRVLFTTAWYPNRKVAGDGVFIQKHAQAIARLNDVAVLMVQTDVMVKGWQIELCHHEASDSLHEVLVYVPKTRFELPVITGLLRLMWLMLGYLKGYRFIRRQYWQGQRPEVCHVNVLTRAAGLPWLLCKLHHIPYIITEHWTRYARPEAYPESQMQLTFGRLFVRDAAYVCPVSYNLEQSMKQWKLESRYYTRIGNVVDTDLFRLPSVEEARIQPAGCVRFVHVSWMRDPAKNISGILRTLSQLNVKRQDWHLDLIGEGNDKEMLMELAHKLGLADLVSFLPAQQGETLARTLRQHDAMLMFSNHENQPVSILEALSCGLPVIATHIAAIPGMLAQKRGITVEARNEAQLLEVLEHFIDMQRQVWQQDGHRGQVLAAQRHDYVVAHHSPQVIAQQFDVLYHAAVSGARRKAVSKELRAEKEV